MKEEGGEVMQLMSLKEYAESRGISTNMLTKMIHDGTVSAGKYGRKWMLVIEIADRQLSDKFAPEPKVKVSKVKKGSYKDALKALAY